MEVARTHDDGGKDAEEETHGHFEHAAGLVVGRGLALLGGGARGGSCGAFFRATAIRRSRIDSRERHEFDFLAFLAASVLFVAQPELFVLRRLGRRAGGAPVPAHRRQR